MYISRFVFVALWCSKPSRAKCNGSFNDRRLRAIEPSLVAHLDFDLIAPLLEESKILTSDEAAHVLRRARTLSKEHAVHELVHILAKSPFRSLRRALEQCASSDGHKELIKELDRLVASDSESGVLESEPKVEQQSDSNDLTLVRLSLRGRCLGESKNYLFVCIIGVACL